MFDSIYEMMPFPSDEYGNNETQNSKASRKDSLKNAEIIDDKKLKDKKQKSEDLILDEFSLLW